MLETHPFWIHGKPCESLEKSDVYNPYNGECVARFYRPTTEDVEAAIVSSVAGAESMRRQSSGERSSLLRSTADRVEAEAEPLAHTLALEAGKPIRHARAEVQRAVNTLQLSAEAARHLGGEVVPMDLSAGGLGKSAFVRRFPIGPVAGITPFNFPLNLVCHKVGPALAAGNSIVLKPATSTPLSALHLARILIEAGAPEGAVNVIPAAAALAEPLIADQRLKMITFTGSAAVGWAMKSRAGKKRVCLELGGNAAVVVEPDADLNRAVDRCVLGGYAFAGQVCISVQRILVHHAVFDEFIDRFTARVADLNVGNPIDDATDAGPMIDEANARRTEAWIDEAVAGGARCLAGGSCHGTLVKPAVLTGTTPTDKVWREEVFAPLVVIESYDSFESALTRVNDSAFGLQAGVFTRDLEKAYRAFDRIEAGGVIVNDVPTFRMDHMPYGGVKDSGFGREGVRYTVEEMTEPKLMVVHHG